MTQEIDSAPDDCDTFIISGCDCNEDLSLMFDLISRIRTRRNHATRIYIQSHCAAFQDRHAPGSQGSRSAGRRFELAARQ